MKYRYHIMSINRRITFTWAIVDLPNVCKQRTEQIWEPKEVTEEKSKLHRLTLRNNVTGLIA
jgi:hypothetical protein